MSLPALALALVAWPTHPIAFARAELSRELGVRDVTRVDLQNDATLGKEVYRIVGDGKRVRIMGGDLNGTMYGALEFAERYRNASRKNEAWKTKAYGKPYLAERGLNLFLTLPWDYKKNDTDYSLEALTDPERWWFQNEDYWETLLDLMARSRLNWLDIHGTWDISVTNAPNLYAYFVTSRSFPNVGVPQAIKDRNLAQLNHIIEMAHARGIRVSLMAYEANLRIPQNPNPGYEATEANIYRYTKEVVEQMIRRCPKLDALGYRIGESGKGESFFHCYDEAVKASGRDIPLITRSWITRRQNVLPLARASKDYTVEIKYNGEQWGAPYMIAGGRMANWYSYSFEDYLSDSSGVPDLPLSAQAGRGLGGGVKPAKLWPGNLVSPSPRMDRVAGRGLGGGEERWPSNPYKIVWQVRANGTHRIFPFYNPEMVRSTIKTMKIGTATGYTIEGLDAYYPKSPDYYLANPADKYCGWIHQRDEMYWMTWGRLGYDPTAKDEVFERHMAKWFGNAAQETARTWSFMSEVIPTIFQAYAIGPDHRNHAPELETGGTFWDFIQAEPFDSFKHRSIRESEAYESLGLVDGRFPNGFNASDIVVGARSGSVMAENGEKPWPLDGSKRMNELNHATQMLKFLSQYFSSQFAIAYDVALAEGRTGAFGRTKDAALGNEGAVKAWSNLAESPWARFYRPFTERLRMRTNTFHWNNLLATISGQGESLSRLPLLPDRRYSNYGDDVVPAGYKFPPKPKLTWVQTGSFLRVRFNQPGGVAHLLEKPLPSSTFFHRHQMKKTADGFEIDLPRRREGHCIAVEYGFKAAYMRFPGDFFRPNECPYLIVPALPGPTPQIYSTEEALTYLNPASLDPKKHASMLVAPRGLRFHNGFDKATIRKVLDPVERGMTLVVMQQDYVSGRYKMDWLPVPLKVENNPQPNVFDPGGALGLKRIETSDILWQRFVSPSPREGERGLGGEGLSPRFGPSAVVDGQPLTPAHEHRRPSPLPGERVVSPGGEGEWEVFGNGGVAHLKWGKGHIWMVNARLMQRMTHPDCARALKALMEFCAQGGGAGNPLTPQPHLPAVHRGEGEKKPVVILDPGTEDAAYSTSFFPDFMNVLDIPFLTLGEVIAKEQGINSFKPIPGKVEDDDILQGNGERMVNTFLRNLVIAASRRPTPKSLAAFEVERKRRKAELMRCLGLDPMPPKTPLNARITGVIQRNGYRIEKLVFESRPKFYVTAHVYVPTSPSPREGERGSGGEGLISRSPAAPHPGAQSPPTPPEGEGGGFPVIVHVNGHWAHKKDEDRIQLRAAFCALQGYIAIAVDSPGWSFEGNSLIERRAEGNHNDWFMVHGGTNATGYYVWDCIRALDYMATRPDTDMSKIGITGASGGGLATLYTFAADDRYSAAVPVVYMASLELAPDNGCLCNHVPGTCQIGDRSDVIAIQAPKPVFIMGAQNDGEFPPDATRTTVEKMQKTWALFSPSTDRPEERKVFGRIFDGPHDYSQPMREQMIGFFNKWLKGQGDGSPVPQPAIAVIDPEDRQLLDLDPAPQDELTMRDLSRESLRYAMTSLPQTRCDPIALNGGRPTAGDLKWRETRISATKRQVTFESERGFVTPAILYLPSGDPKGYVVHVADQGKTSMPHPPGDGRAHLFLDLLGTGELGKLEMRYLLYLGSSVAFRGGWQLVVASMAMRKFGGTGGLEAEGPLACAAAEWAQLLNRDAFGKVSRTGGLTYWEDALKPGMSPYLVQPRAHLMGAPTSK